METRDIERTLTDMSSAAISARLEQVSQLFEVSLLLKSAKKLALSVARNNDLPDRQNEICSGNPQKVLQDNHKP